MTLRLVDTPVPMFVWKDEANTWQEWPQTLFTWMNTFEEVTAWCETHFDTSVYLFWQQRKGGPALSPIEEDYRTGSNRVAMTYWPFWAEVPADPPFPTHPRFFDVRSPPTTLPRRWTASRRLVDQLGTVQTCGFLLTAKQVLGMLRNTPHAESVASHYYGIRYGVRTSSLPRSLDATTLVPVASWTVEPWRLEVATPSYESSVTQQHRNGWRIRRHRVDWIRGSEVPWIPAQMGDWVYGWTALQQRFDECFVWQEGGLVVEIWGHEVDEWRKLQRHSLSSLHAFQRYQGVECWQDEIRTWLWWWNRREIAPVWVPGSVSFEGYDRQWNDEVDWQGQWSMVVQPERVVRYETNESMWAWYWLWVYADASTRARWRRLGYIPSEEAIARWDRAFCWTEGDPPEGWTSTVCSITQEKVPRYHRDRWVEDARTRHDWRWMGMIRKEVEWEGWLVMNVTVSEIKVFARVLPAVHPSRERGNENVLMGEGGKWPLGDVPRDRFRGDA